VANAARLTTFALALVAATTLAGCSANDASTHSTAGVGTQSPNAPPIPRTAVHFRALDGVRIAGSVFGDGTVGAVLGHGSNGDQTEWWPFAQTLARNGYTAFPIDYRGYCPGGKAGCSAEGSTAEAWKDMLGGVRYLRAHGVHAVVLMGSSMGATASLVAAAHPIPGLAGVVALSGSMDCCGMVARKDVIRAITAPMLLIVGRADAGFLSSTRRWGAWAGPSAQTSSFHLGNMGWTSSGWRRPRSKRGPPRWCWTSCDGYDLRTRGGSSAVADQHLIPNADPSP
jgi:dienelactone hydrolase